MTGTIINLSFSARILINAEALNMAETIGSYTRHRRAPVITRSGDSYSVVYVPAVSGESLAHAYQEILVKIAAERGLPVTDMDKNGYFMKYADENVMNYYKKEIAGVLGCSEEKAVEELLGKKPCDIEKAILKTSVVADVAGFLQTNKLIKRMSAIRFSYMLPAADAVDSGGVAVIPQLHARYTPEAKKGEQALFYVESGSALYTLTGQLLVSDIARLNYCNEQDQELLKERPERIKTALDALVSMLDGLIFGAKRSRYNPQWDVTSLIVGVSEGPVEFIVSPGITRDYLKKTYERAASLSKILGDKITVNLYAYNNEDSPKPQLDQNIKNVSFEEVGTHTEALMKARDKVMELIKQKPEG